MAGKAVTKAEIDARRLMVARLLARKLAAPEILAALTALGTEVSLPTVHRDIAAVREEWMAAAVEERAAMAAAELGELREMERDAAGQFAQTHDPRFLAERMKIKGRIAAMMGLDAVVKVEHEHDGRLVVEHVGDWRQRPGGDGDG